jgi:DNA-binding CsgD family transcriptional regulator
MGLSQRDLKARSDALFELYDTSAPEGFPARMLSTLARLVPVDYVTLNDVDWRRRRYVIEVHPAVYFSALMPAFQGHFHTHPLMDAFLAGTPEPLKISDVVTSRQFQEMPLYREFFKHTGTRHQMILYIDRERDRRFGLAFNRKEKDFLERERDMLGYLAPHVVRAYENSIRARVSNSLRSVDEGLGSMRRAMVIADARGNILWGTELALEWLREFFPGWETASALPEELRKRVIATRQQPLPGGSLPHEQWSHDSAHARLLIHCGNAKDGRVLVAMERDQKVISPEKLHKFGLTDREGQILFWLSEAKTNPEIAAILGISPRTIQKHAEHIFTKIGAENRLQAQRIGWDMRRA